MTLENSLQNGCNTQCPFISREFSSVNANATAADPGRGARGMPPVPVKTSHKQMAATCGALYFMFLAPLTILDPMLRKRWV